MNKIVIAIDGYSGCGKSSTAKEVAKKLGFTYIDSGAMYRATALHFLNEKKFPKIEIERRPETGKRNLTTKLQNCFLKINWSLKLTPRPGDSPIKILSIPIGWKFE